MDEVRLYNNPDDEKNFYIRVSQKRARAVESFVKKHIQERSGINILEVGRMPDDFILKGLSGFMAEDVYILEAPKGVWPGAEYVPESTLSEEMFCDRKFRIHTHYANIEKDPLPFKKNYFDIVLFCEVLEHLVFDPVHALIQLRRCLRNDGILVLSSPNVLNWMYLMVLLINHNPRDLYSGYGLYGRHNREFSPWEIETLLSLNGFKMLEKEHIYQPPLTQNRLKTIICWIGNAVTSIPVSFLKEKHGNTLVYLFRKENNTNPVHPRWLFRSRYESV